MSDPSSSRSRARRWFLYAAVACVLSIATWYFGFRSKPQRPRYPQPAWAGTEFPLKVPVRTVAAKLEDLPVFIEEIGSVTPLNSVIVKPRVAGQLLRVPFEEGQRVEPGDLLAEIDPAPYRIRLAQAEGQLRQNMARLESARSDLERIRNLHTQNLITQQQLEVQEALVSEREGAVAADQAEVDDARLQLAYTQVHAPIGGRVGFRRVDVGNLVRESDAEGLVMITQTRPITVTFAIPADKLPAVLEPHRAGETITVEAWNSDKTTLLATGLLKTLDNQIDPATGTLRLKAEFANDDERLFPNQFVNVRMRVRTLEDALVIPSAAVQFGSRGTYVYIVDENNKAALRDVVLGPLNGTQQAITQGLNAGDAVVLEGLDRLREGSNVVISNEPAPSSAAPTAVIPAAAP